jgi:SH3-like domain-containing protein
MKKIIYLFLCLFFLYDSHSFVNADDNFKYLSLRNDKVNVRIGPSPTSPVKWVYEKKNLPVLIVDEYYNWRKIKDFENDSGWVHVSQLSKKRSVLFAEDNILIFNKPTIYSRPIVRVDKLEVASIAKCSLDWCKVKNNLFSGWTKKNSLWGLNKNEIIN